MQCPARCWGSSKLAVTQTLISVSMAELSELHACCGKTWAEHMSKPVIERACAQMRVFLS